MRSLQTDRAHFWETLPLAEDIARHEQEMQSLQQAIASFPPTYAPSPHLLGLHRLRLSLTYSLGRLRMRKK